MNPELSYSEVCERYSYSAETGLIYSKISKRNVGCLDSGGYLQLVIKQKTYKLHRIAWFIYHGKWPFGEIDHIDGNTKNNSIDNLRLTTHAQNCKNRKLNANNSSGRKGVCWYPKGDFWRAYISKDGKWYTLGYFKTKEEAIAARECAEQGMFGIYNRAA